MGHAKLIVCISNSLANLSPKKKKGTLQQTTALVLQHNSSINLVLIMLQFHLSWVDLRRRPIVFILLRHWHLKCYNKNLLLSWKSGISLSLFRKLDMNNGYFTNILSDKLHIIRQQLSFDFYLFVVQKVCSQQYSRLTCVLFGTAVAISMIASDLTKVLVAHYQIIWWQTVKLFIRVSFLNGC